MYVLRLILKSDGKSWAAYKVLKYNFYIGSGKKKSLFSKKKRKGTSYPPIWPRYFVTSCKPEIQSKLLTYETRSFYCVDITSLQS